MPKAPDEYVKALRVEKQRRDATRKAPSKSTVAAPKSRVDRVQRAREAITRGVDYVGNFFLQGRAPELGGAVRQMVEPIAQFPVTMVTDPLRAANQAQQALDPAYAFARGLTTTRMGVQARNPAEIASGVTEMGFAGLSAIPGGAAVKTARATAPVKSMPSPSQNVLAPARTPSKPIQNALTSPSVSATPARMGIGSGGRPQTIQKAQAEGYKGADIGEAREWVAARKKGLDMSQPARMQRAKEQGFTITGYHGTAEDFSQFTTQPPIRFGAGKQEAIFLTEKPDIAASYAAFKDRRLTPQLIEAQRKGENTIQGIPRTTEEIASRYQEGANVMPVKLRLTQPLVVDAKGKSWSEVWDDAVIRARTQSADGIVMKNVQDWGDTESAQEAMSGVDRLMKRNQPLRTVYAVFNPANIRSINAAFDPEEAGSANILAGLGTGAAGVTAASMAGEGDRS